MIQFSRIVAVSALAMVLAAAGCSVDRVVPQVPAPNGNGSGAADAGATDTGATDTTGPEPVVAAGEQGRIQGMNDFFVFGMVTVASVASGGLMNCSGSSAIEGWTAVNYAMIPFLLLAFTALAWYVAFGRKRLRT